MKKGNKKEKTVETKTADDYEFEIKDTLNKALTLIRAIVEIGNKAANEHEADMGMMAEIVLVQIQKAYETIDDAFEKLPVTQG